MTPEQVLTARRLLAEMQEAEDDAAGWLRRFDAATQQKEDLKSELRALGVVFEPQDAVMPEIRGTVPIDNLISPVSQGEQINRVYMTGHFLVDRIEELDWSGDFEQFQREWNGHVDPALSRFQDAILARTRAAEAVSQGERDRELQEIADGAYDDGPWTRGAARDALSRYHFTEEDPFSVTTAEGIVLLGKGWLAISEVEYTELSTTQPTEEAIRADEREKCAKILDEEVVALAEKFDMPSSRLQSPGQWQRSVYKAAIRARASEGGE